MEKRTVVTGLNGFDSSGRGKVLGDGGGSSIADERKDRR
jgi:hypothetical protein